MFTLICPHYYSAAHVVFMQVYVFVALFVLNFEYVRFHSELFKKKNVKTVCTANHNT